MAIPKKVPLPPSTCQSTSTGSGPLATGGFRIEGYEPRKRKAIGTSALEKAFNLAIREQLHSEIARISTWLNENPNSVPPHREEEISTPQCCCLYQLAQKPGPLMSIQLGSVSTLVISSAKMVKHGIKTPDLTFSSRPLLFEQRKLYYNGLDVAFSPYNDSWREIKKICLQESPILLSRKDKVSRIVKKISQLTDSSKSGFGKGYEESEGFERSRFHGLLNEAQAMMGSFFVSNYFPLMGLVDIVTGMSARLEKNFKELDLLY
ncbi:hypothetical protein HYC85_008591 [Camellia sinensis]|uniref:Cytochrome P450 n=1 Tax=Camellia sinensis TaxID=4442 RepID=A0A7J7HT86_CAMSI|nr:hypothetical protein HYC85_008591 [Camellia sinensis]